MVITRSTTENTGDYVSEAESDEEAFESPSHSSDVIFDPLLAYISYCRLSGTRANIKSAVLQVYSGSQIKKSRVVLWRHCADVLGDLPARRATTGPQGRPVKDAYVCDILEAFNRLDAEGKLPAVAVMAADLHAVPRCNAEELCSVSMVDRLDRLEKLVSGLSSDVGNLRATVTSATSLPETTVTVTDTQGRTAPAPLSNQGKKRKKKPKKVPSEDKPSGSAHQVPASVGLASAPPSLAASQESLSGADHSSAPAGDGQFVQPPQHLRREARNERRRHKFITGTAEAFKTIAAGEPRKHLFIYQVSRKTDEQDIRDYISNVQKVEYILLSKISKPEAAYQSFRLTVKSEDYDRLNDASAWPVGVKVRRYFPPKSVVRHVNGVSATELGS